MESEGWKKMGIDGSISTPMMVHRSFHGNNCRYDRTSMEGNKWMEASMERTFHGILHNSHGSKFSSIWTLVEASMDVDGGRWTSDGSCVGIGLFARTVGGSRVSTGIRSGWDQALEGWK